MSVKRLTPNSIANLFMADEAWHDSEYVAAADYDAAAARIVELEAAKDGAYLERNKCVALIARMAMALGYWAGTAKTAIEGWSEDWHGCVYIDLPAGQVSWHYHDSQAHLFDWLPPYCGEWDGHDTPEKYRRVLDRSAMPNARAERAEARLVALEDEKNAYIEYVGDALGQDHDGESLWDAAQRVLSERDRLRAAIERAPHSAGCSEFVCTSWECNCWKAAALAEVGR